MVIPVNPHPVRAARLDCQMRVEDQEPYPQVPHCPPLAAAIAVKGLWGWCHLPLHTPPPPSLAEARLTQQTPWGPLTPN